MRFSAKEEQLIESARAKARPFTSPHDLSSLAEELAPARVVMLGEASHGTQEFYEWRRLLTEELVRHHGFRFLAVEGDWPPCWELNAYVQGRSSARNARDACRTFARWPTWMWANTEIVKLADWLHSHNHRRAPTEKVGFYGLDVYSLFESITAILTQLERVNPFLARKARARYECFAPYGGDENAFAKSLLELPAGCEEQVLISLQELLAARLYDDDPSLSVGEDRLFDAEQNARTVANAERYYRAMMHGTDDSWNVRDRHMQETLEVLLQRHGPGAKAIVWAHNTHIGDYRATSMVSEGQVNLGGLARESFGAENVRLVGFGTHRGTVLAARAWDAPAERMTVPEARPETWDSVLHETAQRMGLGALHLPLREAPGAPRPLSAELGQRAIGVVYRPAYERLGNYVPTSLSERYDHFLFLDETRALEPLAQGFDRNEIPDTYPQGF